MYNGEINILSTAASRASEKIISKECANVNEGKMKKSRKKRRKSKMESIKRCFGFFDFLNTSWKIFKEFSADTSIHGIKYLTDRQRNWTEKLFWSIALILSIIACSYCIYLSWRKRIDSPLIFSFATKTIWEIPFSAITICPTGDPSSINQNYYHANVSLPQSALQNYTSNIEKRITRVKWRQEEYNSNELFTEIVTHEGYCYTFNMMNFYDLFEKDVVFEAFENLKDIKKHPGTSWNLQKGYDSKDPYNYPFRVLGSGENGGLKFNIWRKISEVKALKTSVKGFKLVIHLPCELPLFDQQYYRFPLEKSATLIIRPSMTVTEGLNGYSADVRQCYVEGEKKLTYFKKYTRSNCLLECLAKFNLENCGCIHFSLPRLKTDRVCNSSMENCFFEAKKKLAHQKMKESLDTDKSYNDKDKKNSCKCLPHCTNLLYEGEISQDDIRYFSRSKRSFDAFRSVVSILFKDDDFLYAQRSEIHGWADFIANFGGLLGLFLGVSILSLVEIIYFISFRQLNEESKNPSTLNLSIKSFGERDKSSSSSQQSYKY